MSSAFDRDVWAIFGMPIDNVSLDEAARLVERAVETRERLSFVTPNVNWLVRAIKDPRAMHQIVNADLSLADGAPVVWLARRLGVPLTERVAGSDLFERLRAGTETSALPIRVFFFGGRDGAAERAHLTLAAEQGRLVAAGWHNPGFGDLESMSSAEIIDKINAAKPDFVLVSLGAAKGQAWIEHNQSRLEAPVMAHLGAVVDFVAGTVKRAPRWMSRAGLEWLWRIFAEPSLWSRYWKDGLELVSLTRRGLKLLQSASETETPSSPVSAQTTDQVLKLSGDLVESERDALRQELSAFACTEGDLTLDLNEINAIDASGFGQIRMLEQVANKRGNRVHIQVSPQLEPAFRAANMTA